MNKNENKAAIAFWETIGYITLMLAVFGQVMVGKFYVAAQIAYLVANMASILRDYAMKLPRANKVKDFTFTGITVALILLRLI